MSDYLTKLYNEAEPKVEKTLYSDGTIKDDSGNTIQESTEYNIQKYNQAEPKVAKYLHSDGTIDENPGGSSEPTKSGIKLFEFDEDVAIYNSYNYLESAEGPDSDIEAVISDWSDVKGIMLVVEDKSVTGGQSSIRNKVSLSYTDTPPNNSANVPTDKVATFTIMKSPNSEIINAFILNGIYGDRNVSERIGIKIDSDGNLTISCPIHPKEDSESETDESWSVFKIYGFYLIY